MNRLWTCVATAVMLGIFFLPALAAQDTLVVRPDPSDEVLTNPGIGFMTFQRFNGDALNEGLKWTEGFPIEYQEWDGDLQNQDYPDTTIAYFRLYWKFLEPERGQYEWALIDRALSTARRRGQSLMLRIAPYGTGSERDVPDWYRDMVGPESGLPEDKWQTDPEDPRYLQYFGGMIRALGKRYDGHPDLESVDLSIVGAWGEGAGSELLPDSVRKGLVDAYIESFRKTPLVMLLTDEKTNRYGISQANVGWRVDCLGDMGGFDPNWSHMEDYYPQAIIDFGMRDAWKRAPVTLEVCWVMQHWLNEGWDVDHIINESVKWHISSFNAKSSPVPEEWKPHVDRWLKKMGYRFVLRKWTHPRQVRENGKLAFTSWWENAGVAPSYRNYPLAIRLRSASNQIIVQTNSDIRSWLPGDQLYDGSIFVPADTPEGDYLLDIALVAPGTNLPRVKLAIEGRRDDGWYEMGPIQVVAELDSWRDNGD